MARTKSVQKQVYFQFSVQLAELDHSYPYPSASKFVTFTIPVDLFDRVKIGGMIEKLINECEDDWVKAVSEYEKEQAEKLAKEEAEKEKADIEANMS